MSDDSDSTPTPTRAGSGADLARRMDRMEARQDTAETALNNLSATVLRVEHNQTTSDKLNELRFAALQTKVDTVGATLNEFIKRIDGIISGEIETAQTRQGSQIMADYLAWRAKTDARIEAVEDASVEAKARNAGRLDALSWG